MELQNINSTINNLNHNEQNSIVKPNDVRDSTHLNIDSINISVDLPTMTNRSDLSKNIHDIMNTISTTNSLSSMITKQIDNLTSIDKNINQLSNNILEQNMIQPTIADGISNYNDSVENISQQMAKLKDLDGDSTTYFDGRAGAMPLDVDLLNNEVSAKNAELSDKLNKINQINDRLLKEVKGVIEKETSIAQKAFKTKVIDFGKESTDFNSSNLSSISGSILMSQANASQIQTIKLLS